MNPLDFPKWGSPQILKPKVSNKPTKSLADPVDPSEVTIRIIGDSGQVPLRSVPYKNQCSLGRYLTPLNLKRYAIYRAVYDLTNPSKGRVRMSYVPAQGSVIIIGPSSFSPSSLALSRAEPVVRKKETGPVKTVEEVSLRYDNPKIASEASIEPKQPAEQI